MAEALPNPQVQLNVSRLPNMPRVVVGLGSSAIALTADEARQVAQMLIDKANEVQADIVIAQPNTPIPLEFRNGKLN
jgi:hypothetical protein